MNGDIVEAIVAVLTAVIGVAILAVLLAPKANAAQTIKDLSNGLTWIVGKAVSPVTTGVGNSFLSPVGGLFYNGLNVNIS